MNVKEIRKLAASHREIAAKQKPAGESIGLVESHGFMYEAVSNGPEPYLRLADVMEVHAECYEKYGPRYDKMSRDEQKEVFAQMEADRRRRGLQIGESIVKPQPKKKRKRR